MPKYKMAMTAYGLSRGDTFVSNDPGWATRVTGGVVTVVDEGGSAKIIHRVPPDAVVITRETYQSRVDAGDTEPVKTGEYYREPYQEVVEDGDGD